MKKTVFLCLVLSFILSSCAFTRNTPSFIKSYAVPLFVADIPLENSDTINSGQMYCASKTVNIGNTEVVMPVLPTDALNESLNNKLELFIASLDLAFSPASIDYYCNEAFSTVTFTFYISDSAELFNMTKLHFSYNTQTLIETQLSDFFEEDEFHSILCNTVGEDKAELIDSFSIADEGVNIYINNDKYFISSSLFKKEPFFAVFNPKEYKPVEDGEKFVALTFDDGPNPYTTNGLVDMLEKKGVKATFFMVGYNIVAYPSTVKKVFNGGHDIGIHSYGHTNYSLMKFEDVIKDIDKCADLVDEIIGKKPYLVRPPFGSIKDEEIETEDYFFVNWNVDPLDWDYESAEVIADEAIKNTFSGSIILMHDIYDRSCQAAEIIIDKLLEEGYRFVTISEFYDLNGRKSDNKLHFLKGDYDDEKN